MGRPLYLLPGAAALCVMPVPSATAKPVVSAPKAAIVGATVHVTARDLKPGKYSLTLFANRAPTKNDFCQVRLATAAQPSRQVSFTAKIPRRIPCYSGFPGSARGSIKTTPGTYDLIVAVRQGTSFFSGFSYVRRELRIT